MTKLTLEQHEFDVLKGIIADRLNSLKKNIAKHSDKLDAYENDIDVVSWKIKEVN